MHSVGQAGQGIVVDQKPDLDFLMMQHRDSAEDHENVRQAVVIGNDGVGLPVEERAAVLAAMADLTTPAPGLVNATPELGKRRAAVKVGPEHAAGPAEHVLGREAGDL